MTKIAEGRRPLKARESNWAKNFAAWMAKQNIQPNFLSVMSMVFGLLSFIAFYAYHKTNSHVVLYMLIAIIGVAGRGLMNIMDGMVAIEHGKKSAVGGLFNEVPDRVSDTFLIMGAGLLIKNLPYGFDLAYIASALAIATAYIRNLGASLNCGHFFIGPMAKTHRMAMIVAGCVASIWFSDVFYYILMVMNVGLIITCYRRLHKIYVTLKNNPIN